MPDNIVEISELKQHLVDFNTYRKKVGIHFNDSELEILRTNNDY